MKILFYYYILSSVANVSISRSIDVAALLIWKYAYKRRTRCADHFAHFVRVTMLVPLIAAVALLAVAPSHAEIEKFCTGAMAGTKNADQSTEYHYEIPPGVTIDSIEIPHPGIKNRGVHVWACDKAEAPKIQLFGFGTALLTRGGVLDAPAKVTITVYFV